MNSESSFDDFLIKQLQAPKHYINDDGFSAGVMAALPKTKIIHPIVELFILCVPSILVAVLVFRHLSWRDWIQPICAALLSIDTSLVLQGCATIGASLAVGFALWGIKQWGSL